LPILNPLERLKTTPSLIISQTYITFKLDEIINVDSRH